MGDIPQYVPPDIKDRVAQVARAGVAVVLFIGSQAACSPTQPTNEQQKPTANPEASLRTLINPAEKPIPYSAQDIMNGLKDGTMMVEYVQTVRPSSSGPCRIITLYKQDNGVLFKGDQTVSFDFADALLPHWAVDEQGKNEVITVISSRYQDVMTYPNKQKEFKTLTDRKLIGLGKAEVIYKLPSPISDSETLSAIQQGLQDIRGYVTSQLY